MAFVEHVLEMSGERCLQRRLRMRVRLVVVPRESSTCNGDIQIISSEPAGDSSMMLGRVRRLRRRLFVPSALGCDE